MVKKWYCDICTIEIQEDDRNTLNSSNQVVNNHYDLCVKCAVLLLKVIEDFKKKGFVYLIKGDEE